MPFLNFGGNKNKYCSLSDMDFFIKNMKNIKNRYSDPDPDPCQNEMDPKRCKKPQYYRGQERKNN